MKTIDNEACDHLFELIQDRSAMVRLFNSTHIENNLQYNLWGETDTGHYEYIQKEDYWFNYYERSFRTSHDCFKPKAKTSKISTKINKINQHLFEVKFINTTYATQVNYQIPVGNSGLYRLDYKLTLCIDYKKRSLTISYFNFTINLNYKLPFSQQLIPGEIQSLLAKIYIAWKRLI